MMKNKTEIRRKKKEEEERDKKEYKEERYKNRRVLNSFANFGPIQDIL